MSFLSNLFGNKRPNDPSIGSRLKDTKGIDMVYVPKGKFMMGSNEHKDEQPVHKVVILQGFWLDLTPVTNTSYKDFIQEGGYDTREYWTESGWEWKQANKRKGPNDFNGFTDPQQPRVGVSWYEAYAYCQWRGGRLPTEAEWEWAARGPKNRVYPWGESFNERNILENTNRVFFGLKSLGVQSDIFITASVGPNIRVLGASWVGALDMCGNTKEWVNSLRRPYPYKFDDGREDCNDPEEENFRCLRGLEIYVFNAYVRAAYRDSIAPMAFGGRNIDGFRCARSWQPDSVMNPKSET